jgi:hypothetical protein
VVLEELAEVHLRPHSAFPLPSLPFALLFLRTLRLPRFPLTAMICVLLEEFVGDGYLKREICIEFDDEKDS